MFNILFLFVVCILHDSTFNTLCHFGYNHNIRKLFGIVDVLFLAAFHKERRP